MEDLTPPDHVRPPTAAHLSPRWAFCSVPSRLA
jgi:hypothetical protein